VPLNTALTHNQGQNLQNWAFVSFHLFLPPPQFSVRLVSGSALLPYIAQKLISLHIPATSSFSSLHFASPRHKVKISSLLFPGNVYPGYTLRRWPPPPSSEADSQQSGITHAFQASLRCLIYRLPANWLQVASKVIRCCWVARL
jgi:hypothetical protein